METSTQWQLARDAAERYQRILVPAILGPAARSLVERCELGDGESVLDAGCGTGAAARFAAEKVGPAGRVAGLDLNAAMIEVARSLGPVQGAEIEWHESTAYELPFPEGDFDVALCAQTLQFLDDRQRALAEIHRVLRPGGRVAVSLWCELPESPYFHGLVEAVSERIGTGTAAGLRSAFALSESDAIQALLTEAGFRQIEAKVERLDLDLPEPGDFVPRHVSATPMAAGFHAASEGARQAVVDQVTERLALYGTERGMRVPFRTHLVSALKE
jgi:ubiquinone/menaquinone biosynthesis C-methylase UbiE